MPVTTIKLGNGVGKATSLSAQNPNSNYSAATNLQVAGFFGSPSGPNYSFLIQIPLDEIPNGAEITKGTLRLYKNDDAATPTRTNISFHVVNGDWVESTVTYNTRPSFQATSYLQSTVNRNAGWYSYNVPTDLMQEWKDGTRPNFGIYVAPQWYEGTLVNRSFHSPRHGTTTLRPELVVEWKMPKKGPQGRRGYNAPIIGRRGRGVLTF